MAMMLATNKRFMRKNVIRGVEKFGQKYYNVLVVNCYFNFMSETIRSRKYYKWEQSKTKI